MEESTEAEIYYQEVHHDKNKSFVQCESPKYVGLEEYIESSASPKKSLNVNDIKAKVKNTISSILESSKQAVKGVANNVKSKLSELKDEVDREDKENNENTLSEQERPECSKASSSKQVSFKDNIVRTFETSRIRLTTFKEKFLSKVKLFKDNDSTKDSSDSKIFVTRSSIEFAKIKADAKFNDQQPRTHPIIGACVIAFPYALKQAGLPMSVLLLLVLSVMVEYSEVLLIQCSILAADTSLQNISKSLFGTPGYIISFIIPYMYSLSVLLSYNIILGDTCTKFIQYFLQAFNSSIIMNRKLTLFLLAGIIIPISMTTNVKRIFKWSLVSLISASFVTVVISIRMFTLSPDVPPIYNAFKFLNMNILQSIAVMSFALSCQHTCRLYYATIDQGKELNPNKPASIASSYSLLCTVVVGVFGYLTFKSVTQGNVLENYCEEDMLATFARLFFAAFTLCLFPMECQSLRHLIQQSVVVHKKFQNLFHYIMTLIVLLPALIASLFVDCLSVVLETAGFLLAIPLVFILPSVFYVQLSPGKIYSKQKLPCLISIATGATISICGLTTTLFSNHYCIHQSKMFPYCNGSNELLGPLITLLSLNGTSNFDPRLLGFNASNFDGEFDNVTDMAHAYFTT